MKLSSIKPGTEQVQLIPNGDFQFQGPLVGANHPTPDGWNRANTMFADPGTNMVSVNSDVVAWANAEGGVAGLYTRSITLEPNTAYTLSVYMWNMGDTANYVNTVIDFSDAPSEPQILLGSGDSEANKGYFCYRTFNTSATGTNITLRAFYDGKLGTGTAASNYPVAAQWDNIAITKSANFVAPQASGSGATLRPLVTITDPANSSAFFINSSTNIVITASASDMDGTVTNVQFFVGATKVGETSGPAWNATWSDPTTGSYVLTAIATDNTGATTFSAPVSVTISSSIPPAPGAAYFRIAATVSGVSLYWPTSDVPRVMESATNLASPIAWLKVTNETTVANGTNVLELSNSWPQRYFRLVYEVDPSTMYHKLLMGYQGWFACQGDGSANNQWVHWFHGGGTTENNANFDLWPDTSELDADELFNTSMTYSNGQPAKLYSAYKQKTVVRHFKWMRDNHLDGVFFQRFLSDLPGGNLSALRNQVAMNVRVGAETYGRVFAIMYDISGYSTNTLVSKLTNDWLYLVNTQHVTNSTAYLHHNGKPVVAIWGWGFSGRQDTPEQAQQVIDWFKAAGCTVMGGLPTNWRTLNGDAQTNPGWSNVFRAFDVISPWSVGRYGNNGGADNFRVNQIVPDLAAANAAGRDYLPVIFPGFSWHNMHDRNPANPFNQTPRNGGQFYWRQAYNAVLSGCTMIYGAMFDEVDEGTAMFKMMPTSADLPAQGMFMPLNIDGYNLPSDWYLRLADSAGQMLRGEIPLQNSIPITP